MRIFEPATASELNWREADFLIGKLGGEESLAERVTAERRTRGWSQDELARRMSEVGCSIGQSAISKIEKPPPSGRRAITVDEAVGFALAFDIPLVELLLPAGVTTMVEQMKDLAEGPELRQAAARATSRYEALVKRVHVAIGKDDRFRTLVEERLRSASGREMTSTSDATQSAAQFYRDALAGEAFQS